MGRGRCDSGHGLGVSRDKRDWVHAWYLAAPVNPGCFAKPSLHCRLASSTAIAATPSAIAATSVATSSITRAAATTVASAAGTFATSTVPGSPASPSERSTMASGWICLSLQARHRLLP